MLFILNRIDHAVGQLEKALLVFFCFVLTMIMIAQVILRYFFSSPIFWAEEISVQLLVFITAFGISYLTQQKQHIKIDFVLAQLSDSSKKQLMTVLDLVFLALMAVICYYSWEWVLRPDVQVETSGTTGLPRWYNYMVLPVALSFLCWHQFVALLNTFCGKPASEAA